MGTRLTTPPLGSMPTVDNISTRLTRRLCGHANATCPATKPERSKGAIGQSLDTSQQRHSCPQMLATAVKGHSRTALHCAGCYFAKKSHWQHHYLINPQIRKPRGSAELRSLRTKIPQNRQLSSLATNQVERQPLLTLKKEPSSLAATEAERQLPLWLTLRPAQGASMSRRPTAEMERRALPSETPVLTAQWQYHSGGSAQESLCMVWDDLCDGEQCYSAAACRELSYLAVKPVTELDDSVRRECALLPADGTPQLWYGQQYMISRAKNGEGTVSSRPRRTSRRIACSTQRCSGVLNSEEASIEECVETAPN